MGVSTPPKKSKDFYAHILRKALEEKEILSPQKHSAKPSAHSDKESIFHTPSKENNVEDSLFLQSTPSADSSSFTPTLYTNLPTQSYLQSNPQSSEQILSSNLFSSSSLTTVSTPNSKPSRGSSAVPDTAAPSPSSSIFSSAHAGTTPNTNKSTVTSSVFSPYFVDSAQSTPSSSSIFAKASSAKSNANTLATPTNTPQKIDFQSNSRPQINESSVPPSFPSFSSNVASEILPSQTTKKNSQEEVDEKSPENIKLKLSSSSKETDTTQSQPTKVYAMTPQKKHTNQEEDLQWRPATEIKVRRKETEADDFQKSLAEHHEKQNKILQQMEEKLSEIVDEDEGVKENPAPAYSNNAKKSAESAEEPIKMKERKTHEEEEQETISSLLSEKARDSRAKEQKQSFFIIAFTLLILLLSILAYIVFSGSFSSACLQLASMLQLPQDFCTALQKPT